MMIKLSTFLLLSLISLGVTKQLRKEYKLHQVLIFSRHNLRTPIHDNQVKITSKVWPKWTVKSGELTPKGALLEGYMGEYFAEWLRDEKVLSNACPTENDLFVYANIKQRTKESAKAFVKKGFPECDIKVHTKNATADPVFNPVIHNETKEFDAIAVIDMKEKLSAVHVTSIFEKLNDILDVKNSPMCLNDKYCDLAKEKTIVKPVVSGKAPSIKGPLKLSNTVVDAFLMEYYDGKPLDQVAWGNVANEEAMGHLVQITKEYHSVIFNTTVIAKDIAKPLVKCIKDIFKSKSGYPSVSLLMGHDANMLTLLKTLNFKAKELPNQIENTPVGGKIVFQKLLDSVTGNYFLKVNFVYLTPSQMRHGDRVSKDNPPQYVVLELENCKIDENGLCPWDDFIRLLDGLY